MMHYTVSDLCAVHRHFWVLMNKLMGVHGRRLNTQETHACAQF